jgi:hypothetical protein
VPFKTDKEIIRAGIRELQQLEKLLDSPYVAAILPKLLQARLSNAPSKDQLKLPVTPPKRKSGRKPGPLAEKAFNVIRNSMSELSAKDVLVKLESAGVSIPGKEAKDRAVTVSKVLRLLAKAGRISSRPSGPSKKAAILYQSNALAQSFPVQEKAVTQ